MNVPNMLSIFRLCLVPVFVAAYFSSAEHAKLIAAAIYAVATFTDFLDGYIARKYNLITNLGKVLDPLGDKVLTFAALTCLTIDGIIPLPFVLIFCVKEATMGIGGLLIHRKAKTEIPPSNYLGKTATVLFFVSCAVLMIFENIPQNIAALMILAALITSVSALISYSFAYAKIMKQHNNN